MRIKIHLLISIIALLLIFPAVQADENVNFIITNISQVEFRPSETATLTITLENKGTGNVVSLFSTIETSGLPIQNVGEAKKYLGSIQVYPPEKVKVNYSLYVDEFAEKGVYVIPLNLDYKTEARDERKNILNFSIRVVGSKNIGKVEIVEIKTSPQRVFPGNMLNVSINLKNVGVEDADKITLNLVPNYPFSSIGNIPSRYIQILKPNQTLIRNFIIGIDSSSDPGLYEIETSLEYFSKDAKISQKNISFGVIIFESLGILDMSNVNIKKETVQPGDIFGIELSPKNLGTEPIKDINIKLIPKPPFGTVQGVPEAYIKSLKPNESGSVVFNISVDRIAPTRQFYPMDFEVDYKSQNKKYLKNGTFNIAVKGHPTIYIQEIIVEPSKLTSGSEGLLLIRLINTGTERAEDLKITISGGENILTESYQFIGGLETDKFETSSFGIYIDPNLNPGIYALNMNISYKDRYGNQYSDQRISEISVYKSDSLIFYFMILGGLLAVSLLILVIIITAKGWVANK